jgi:hypothetical protein
MRGAEVVETTRGREKAREGRKPRLKTQKSQKRETAAPDTGRVPGATKG